MERVISRLAVVLLALVAIVGCGKGSQTNRLARGATKGLIVPQQSIDKLKLGMTPAAVRQVFGKPDAVQQASESETGKPIDDWLYRRRGLTAEFRQVTNGRFSLAGVFTTSPQERSASGAGVGRTERQLKAALTGLDCGPGDPGERWCTVGGNTPDARQTVFFLRSGRVTEVRVLITYS